MNGKVWKLFNSAQTIKLNSNDYNYAKHVPSDANVLLRVRDTLLPVTRSDALETNGLTSSQAGRNDTWHASTRDAFALVYGKWLLNPSKNLLPSAVTQNLYYTTSLDFQWKVLFHTSTSIMFHRIFLFVLVVNCVLVPCGFKNLNKAQEQSLHELCLWLHIRFLD